MFFWTAAPLSPSEQVECEFNLSDSGEYACCIRDEVGIREAVRGSVGVVVNFLAPYRGNAGVDELISWLCR